MHRLLRRRESSLRQLFRYRGWIFTLKAAAGRPARRKKKRPPCGGRRREFSLEAEYEEHGRVLHILEGGRLVLQIPGLHVPANEHGDILLAIDRIGHWRSRAEGSGIKAPERLQR